MDLHEAVFWLAHELEPNPGTRLRIGGGDDHVVEDPSFTEAEVAQLIRQADPASVTGAHVRQAMCDTVDLAMYWQPPDGEDAVAALPAVRDALSPVADRVVALLPEPTASAVGDQWAVDWHTASESAPIERAPAAVLAKWSSDQREDEDRAARERPTDPHANFSSTW